MRFFTVKEVAELLRVSLGTIYGAIDRGELKAHRFGRRTACRISEDSLREFVESCAEAEPKLVPKSTGMHRHLGT